MGLEESFQDIIGPTFAANPCVCCLPVASACELLRSNCKEWTSRGEKASTSVVWAFCDWLIHTYSRRTYMPVACFTIGIDQKSGSEGLSTFCRQTRCPARRDIDNCTVLLCKKIVFHVSVGSRAQRKLQWKPGGSRRKEASETGEQCAACPWKGVLMTC